MNIPIWQAVLAERIVQLESQTTTMKGVTQRPCNDDKVRIKECKWLLELFRLKHLEINNAT